MTVIAVSEPRVWSWTAVRNDDDELQFIVEYQSQAPGGNVYFTDDIPTTYVDGNDITSIVSDNIDAVKTVVSDTALPIHYSFPG